MKHLSRREFVDLIEGASTLPAERVQHAETCQQCSGEAAALRAMLSEVRTDEIPEPSPLFWKHFAGRVSDELQNQPAPVDAHRWTRLPFATWAIAGTVALLLISTVMWRATLHAPAPHNAMQTAAAPDVAAVADPGDDLENDEAWAVVRTAAADLAWEDARDAGITAHPGDVEKEALQLDAAERVELARLLNEDLKRNGA